MASPFKFKLVSFSAITLMVFTIIGFYIQLWFYTNYILSDNNNNENENENGVLPISLSLSMVEPPSHSTAHSGSDSDAHAHSGPGSHLIALQNGVMYDHWALDYLARVINDSGFPSMHGVHMGTRPMEELLYANVSSSFYGRKFPVYVCEIGSAYGYSTLTFLNGNPDAVYIGFDLDVGWGRIYFIPIHDQIIADRRLNVGHRIRWLYGESNRTLRDFAQEIAHPWCDLVHVDGSHLYADVLADLRLVRKIVNRTHHWVLMDDCMDFEKFVWWDVHKALNVLIQEGQITNYRHFQNIEPDQNYTNSFVCMFQFQF